MRPVWLVRWQELAGRVRFWTAIVGYDPRDRSLRQVIYLVYVVIFFSLWGFAVLTLLADLGSGVLSLARGLAPLAASVALLAGGLLLLTFMQAFRAGIRSPFIFSEADAELICQSPVNRGYVALAWFVGDWFLGGLVFTALAVVLRFATLQMALPGGFTWPHLPGFLLAGVQAAGIVILLHLAFGALVFAFGGLRLHGGQDKYWLRWIPLWGGVLLLLIILGRVSVAQVLLWPLLYPLQAAFGFYPWLPGLGLALSIAISCLCILYWAGQNLNLSRAAQESLSRGAIRRAAMLAGTRLSWPFTPRQKLASGHSPSHILARQGIFSLPWKAIVAATRLSGFGTVFEGLGIFGAGLSMLQFSDWGTRLWAFVIWGLLVAQLGISGLKSDLAVWAFTRQLPFSLRAMLIAECAVPVSSAILASWCALLASYFLAGNPPLILILVFPASILCIVFSAAYDVLHNSRSAELLAGQVAELGAAGLLLGVVSGALPIALISLLAVVVRLPVLVGLVDVFGLALAGILVYAVWSLASHAYKSLG